MKVGRRRPTSGFLSNSLLFLQGSDVTPSIPDERNGGERRNDLRKRLSFKDFTRGRS
jgi:hypothetical protein